MVRMASWVGWPRDPWEGHKVRGAVGGDSTWYSWGRDKWAEW